MDWLSLNILNWWPWASFNFEHFIFQFSIIFFLYLFLSSLNIYFSLFYLFIFFFFLGCFLSFFNLELFTAFLWLTECVVIFISILLLFYLNVHGNFQKKNIIILSFKYFGVVFSFILFISNFVHLNESEFFLPIELNFHYLWDDYYESLWNRRMNDLFGLYISYYILNSFEFLCIGFILLIGSVICVNFNKLNKGLKSRGYFELLVIFDFFNDFVKFFFMRKQNLVDQTIKPASTKHFKKKTTK